MDSVKKTKGFISEFKTFISQGNILDLAVGVVIGTAFKAIVSSLVADIIMPTFGMIVGNANLSDLKHVFTDAGTDANGVATPEVAIRYGLFLQYIIDFLIIALCMFIVIKVAIGFRKKLDSISKKEKAEAAAVKATTPAEQTNDEKMLSALTEIRDILKDNNNIK
ncbi:MAG: hypothetical protein A2Y15_09095 [Clostridiales bacterium GWF2_36_10]|nr:MAG: hypothetical protein A2Y15_09095 [Clostridiales bacterium GWF2_36_10]HAN21465.1 large conductance mechanosensitive channel protein MscL [Clostridiales bacterium]